MSSLCRLYVVFMSSLCHLVLWSLSRTTRLNCRYISPSIVVMIPACHSGGRGSSPCWGSNLYWKFYFFLILIFLAFNFKKTQVSKILFCIVFLSITYWLWIFSLNLTCDINFFSFVVSMSSLCHLVVWSLPAPADWSFCKC